MKKQEKGSLWCLLFWPAFGLRYLLLEAYRPPKGFHTVSCKLDERIPFLEWFVIAYLLWYFCMVGLHLWLCFHDRQTYRQYTLYLLVSTAISTAVFLLWPSCQKLRPQFFPRDNLMTELVKWIYRMDTSTNVFPSEHVIGAAGLFLAARHCSRLGALSRGILMVTALLSAAATVFLKQHSVLDVAAALMVSMVGYGFSFGTLPLPERKTGEQMQRRFLP